jgi:hypothetical protein
MNLNSSSTIALSQSALHQQFGRAPGPDRLRLWRAPTHPEQIEEQALGRNLAAAFIATRQGIGLDYARKRHAHELVGEFWLSVARMVIDHIAQYAAPPGRRGPSRIQ